MEEENRKILQYAKQQSEREQERMEKKRQEDQAKAELQEKVSIFFMAVNLSNAKKDYR